MEAPAYPFRIYFWLVRDERTGQLRKTRFRMTEAEAETYFKGAVRVEQDFIEISGPSPGTGHARPNPAG